MKKLLLIALIYITGCRTPENKMYGARPNILWIMIENWGYDLSCYGAKGVYTPNVDGLASEGIRFTNSFVTSPVCSPARSAMMTGFHQQYIECEHHRASGPGFVKKALPYGIKPITHMLEEAGYYTCIMGIQKTDLNFTTDKPLYMGNDWSGRKEGQPFYALVTFNETDRYSLWDRDTINPVDLNDVTVPPHYPDTPFTRRDIANGMEAMQVMDRKIAKLLQRLDDEGLKNNTIVFLVGDNGKEMPRGIQFLYDEGIEVPIICRWPGYIAPNQVSDHMVMTIDVCATILDVAGINPGYELHGKNLFGKEVAKRKYIFASRDKMDWTFDAMRAIRSKEYKLIHNLMPERPYCQYNEYKEEWFPVLALLNKMNLKGELTPAQARFLAEKKPDFELYNVVNDPYELNNLADDPKYAKIKNELLSHLMDWRKSVNDKGISDEFRKGGWPATYPTRSLEEWTEIVEKWEDYLLGQNTNGEIPRIPKIPGMLSLKEILSMK
jgi:N-sulfoglucosamine sulfohydrolase